MLRCSHIIIIVLIMAFLFSGCASIQKSAIIESKPSETEKEKAEQTREVDLPSSDTGASKSRVQGLVLPKYERPKPEKPLPETEPIDPTKLSMEDKPVMINAEGMPLYDFIVYAIGDTLKVTFFIDDAVKNMKTPVTLRMTHEMPAPKVLEIAIEVLRQHDLLIEERAGALYILKSKAAPREPADIRVGRTAVDSPAQIVQIVPLRHLKASDILSLITELFKTNVSAKVYQNENALLLTGPSEAIKNILNFIEFMDAPYLSDKKLFMIELTYWQPDEFIKQMSTILEGIGFKVSKTPRDPGILFIPIKFLNSILAVSPDDNTTKIVMEWKERLDTAEAAGAEEKVFTYSPKFSRASDLVESIQKLYGGVPHAPAQAKAAPAPAAPAQSTSALSGPTLKISSDDRRNVVAIIATPVTYKAVLSFLIELDKPPRQVLIEATAAELTLKDDLKYGLEWFIKNKMFDGEYTLTTLGKLGVDKASGLAYSFISDTQKFLAVINAFAKDNMINILSSPRLMILDNEEATIQIGQEVPIITSEVSAGDVNTVQPSVLRNVQYRTTGVILRVKPTINTEGLLTLNISQEVSEAQTNTTSGIDSPLILMRKINTMVVAATGKSVILGGIMAENNSETEIKVPLLGDIPIFGNLFKSVSKSKTKTELIIILTATILRSTDEAVSLTNEMRKSIKWLK